MAGDSRFRKIPYRIWFSTMSIPGRILLVSFRSATNPAHHRLAASRRLRPQGNLHLSGRSHIMTEIDACRYWTLVQL
jgi:hypothetical protein